MFEHQRRRELVSERPGGVHVLERLVTVGLLARYVRSVDLQGKSHRLAADVSLQTELYERKASGKVIQQTFWRLKYFET